MLYRHKTIFQSNSESLSASEDSIQLYGKRRFEPGSINPVGQPTSHGSRKPSTSFQQPKLYFSLHRKEGQKEES